MTKDEFQLGDAPVEDQYRRQMEAIARVVDEFINGDAKGKERKNAFVLLMFPFGDPPGRCNFMTNGVDREDIIVLFKEMISRFEGQPEHPVGHA